MNRFKAVLFDLDGTLARTMEDTFRAWKAVLKEYGVDLKPEEFYPLEGTGLHELAKRLFEIYHLEVSHEHEEELVRKKERYYLENYHFALYPGVEELIELLRAKSIPIAIVTTGLTDRVHKSALQGFLEKFDVIVSGDDIDKTKPSPTPYLKGAKKLGISPEDCIVVENAPLGIESAKSAGAYCIAISTTLNKSYLQKADEILNSFDDLKNSEGIKQLIST